MKRLLAEHERRAVRAALWADVKRLPIKREDRLTFLEMIWLDWLAEREKEDELSVLERNDSA